MDAVGFYVAAAFVLFGYIVNQGLAVGFLIGWIGSPRYNVNVVAPDRHGLDQSEYAVAYAVNGLVKFFAVRHAQQQARPTED